MQFNLLAETVRKLYSRLTSAICPFTKTDLEAFTARKLARVPIVVDSELAPLLLGFQ